MFIQTTRTVFSVIAISTSSQNKIHCLNRNKKINCDFILMFYFFVKAMSGVCFHYEGEQQTHSKSDSIKKLWEKTPEHK